MEPIELEPATGQTMPVADKRPLVPEPLPVRLLTVDDATLPAATGLEVQLDAFYVGLLKFERDAGGALIYEAENFRLHFALVERFPERESVRPLVVEVPRLSEIELTFIEQKIEYTRLRGLSPGEERLAVQDPAGNWVEIVEYRGI